MKEYRWTKTLAFVGLCSTVVFGEPAFYGMLAVMIAIYSIQPQAYLGLLLFSGLIKIVPAVNQLPIDITLAAYLLFIVYFFVQRITHASITKDTVLVTWVVAMAFLMVSISLIITPAPWSYLSKSGIFIILLYLPLVMMIVLLPTDQMWKIVNKLLGMSLLIGYAWVGMGLHHELLGYSPPRLDDPTEPVAHLSAFGEDYMAFSSFIIFIFLDAFIQFLFKRSYFINGALLIVLVFAIVNSPARGLTLGLLLASLLLLAIWLRRPSTEKIILSIVMPTTFVALLLIYFNFFLSDKSEFLIQRLVDFDLSGTSITTRITSVTVAWEQWKDHFLFGTGTDSVAFFNHDTGLYTHNLILEIIFEYGLLGGIPLLLFVALSLGSFYFVLKNRIYRTQAPAELWLAGVFITFVTFGMFSGTLGNMRPLWILFSIAIALGIHERRVSFGQPEKPIS